MLNKKIIKSIFIFFLPLYLFAQYDYYIYDIENTFDGVYDERFATILLLDTSWEFKFPVIDLAKGNALQLSFDMLVDEVYDLYVVFSPCSPEWQILDEPITDFIEGFNENPIFDYSFSRNTLISYINYYYYFPNEDIKFKRSGNYLLTVYYHDKENNKYSKAFSKRFVVSEQALLVNAHVIFASDVTERFYRQQVLFSFTSNNIVFNNIYERLYVCLLQNGRWIDAHCNIKPTYMKDNIVYFDESAKNFTTFDGNNEFRYFDIRSISYQTGNLAGIMHDSETVHVYLVPDISRRYTQYLRQPDLNGRFFISNDLYSNINTESEYYYVHFAIKSEPITEGAVYLIGDFTNYEIIPRYRMQYNYEAKQYELCLLLKQGYYNYAYALVPNQTDILNISYFEGNHSETENEYQGLIYYREESD
ncbi:MAG: DUF5103 domain-containing protein [Bacteroidales bacterium]|nr:DUF5103 domain-containing protein [Bacteroidales bacterium]